MRPLVGALASAILRRREEPPLRIPAAFIYSLFVLGRVGRESDHDSPPSPRSTKDGASRFGVQQKSKEDLAKASDLRGGGRDIAIVTTASLPWMTGTAINPVLRAVFLAKDGHRVTIVVPWIPSIEDQRQIFAANRTFGSTKEQASFIQSWLIQQGFGDVDISIRFYDAVYSSAFGSILPVGAVTDVFAHDDIPKDVCVLEEPEHLTWHHAGEPWTDMFNVVVGVIHTNYIEYTRKYGFFGPQRAFFLLMLNIWVCRSYCHRVIKLSDAVQHFPHSVTCNVHGVRDRFINIGRNLKVRFPRGAYFMAKVLWSKGYRELIGLLRDHYARCGEPLSIDFFGDGPDADEVRECVDKEEALSNVNFEAKVVDHAGEHLQQYRLYINASVSEVVCTATAEALAMGKTVVCIKHPSNEFFETFPNCYTYSTAEEFSHLFLELVSKEPTPLPDSDLNRLTWKAATQRFYNAAHMPMSERRTSMVVDGALANAHTTLSKVFPQPGENIRRNQARTRDSPEPQDQGVIPGSELSTHIPKS